MAQASIDLDVEAVLRAVERDLSEHLGADRLRTIRDLFDDALFLPALKSLLQRRHNDPGAHEIPNTLVRIMRKAEELRDERETSRGWVSQFAVGGSAALVVSSVIACLNPAIGIPALIVLGGGVAIGGTGWVGIRRLDKERTLCKQIADRLAIIVKAIE